jgi:hypothetical protein
MMNSNLSFVFGFKLSKVRSILMESVLAAEVEQVLALDIYSVFT